MSWLISSFNPRAREGRDGRTGSARTARSGFNPRAREGRDEVDVQTGVSNTDVSTHAPAKGATGICMERRRYVQFQPTRPRRARHSALPQVSESRSFNPRAREGRDGGQCGILRHGAVVSTHAPAKGATYLGRNSVPVLQEFQPTRPRRARRKRFEELCDASTFQPTRPRRARPAVVLPRKARRRSFNPRAREGRDKMTKSEIFKKAHSFNPRAREGRDHS